MPTSAFELLRSPPNPQDLPAVVVLFGDDATLRIWSLAAITAGGDAETVEGDEAEWRDVRDEVSTASLFDDGPRTVIVRRADPFLKRYRTEIEDYLAKPSSAGRLILELDSCPANTRVYKQANKHHLLIQCSVPKGGGRSKTPDLLALRKFLCDFVAPRHQCQLAVAAADQLIELLGADVGMLETEIAKLALYLEPGGKVTEQMVREIVGGWRAATIWQTIDAVATGNAAAALQQLDRALASGEAPIAMLPQFAWSMRRLGMATAAIEYAESQGRRIPLSAALSAAGYREFELKKVEQQLRQLGRERARHILPWLLEADLKLKGSHSTTGPDRWVLEEFILKLAKAGNT